MLFVIVCCIEELRPMMSTIPFTAAAVRRRPHEWRWPWRSGASIVVAVLLWWGLAGLSGVTAITLRSDTLVLPLAEPQVSERDWPGWRGGMHQGVAPAANLPLQWSLPQRVETRSQQEQVSPPCVIGEAVFFTRQIRSTGETWLACLDRATGVPRWRVSLGLNDPASSMLPTPASDGTRVLITSSQRGELIVSAFSLTGQRLWSQIAGPLGRPLEAAQSPVIAGALVYVAIDQKAPPWQWSGIGGFVAALHRQTGQIVWRTPRAGSDGFATPVVATFDGHRQLILPGRGHVRSYDADTGRELWHARWSARTATASVVCDEHAVYATTSIPERETICIRADGQGDVDDSHVEWRVRSTGSTLSPVLMGANVIVANGDGSVTALDRQQGRMVWQQRLSGRYSTAPLLAGSRLYCPDDDGSVTVLDVQQHGQIIGHSRGEGLQGIAVAGDQLLFTSPDGLAIISASGPTQIAHEDLGNSPRR